MRNTYILLSLYLVTISAATPAISADMSNWSDKTICRLANETSRSRNDYIEEVTSRKLGCITNNGASNISSNKETTAKKPSVFKNIENTNAADAFNDFKSTYNSSLPECKGNSAFSKLFIAPFTSWNNCWGGVSFKMFTNIPKQRKGDEYIGEFKSGKFHGNGAYFYQGATHKKNNLYIGEFSSDMEAGKGKYYLFNSKDKKYYDGHFLNNKLNGIGTLYFKNGDTYEGLFEFDLFKKGIHTLKDGTSYEGSWTSGRKNGYFKYIGIDGVSKNQYYKRGVISKNPEEIAAEQKIIDDQLESELALQLEVSKDSTLADLAKTKGFFESELFNEGFELYKVLQDPGQGSRVIIDVKGTVSVISDKLASGVKTSSSTTKTSSACPENPDACSNDFVCKRGTIKINGTRIWDERSKWIKYSVEAKKRGLSCGVASTSSAPKISSACPENIGTCTNDFLCRRGTSSISGKKVWHQSFHSFYKYTVEAKKRGFSCCVGSDICTSSVKNRVMSRTYYKSALANSKHGRLVIVSVGSISFKDEIKEIITRKKKYKSGTKDIPNTLYFKKVEKLNALYRKLGKKNNSQTSINKQYNTYCSSDTMTGVNCSTQPDYGANARAEIASSAIDFFFDALDGVQAMKKEVRTLEGSLGAMSPLKKVTTYLDHAVKISSSRSDVDYRVDVTYIDLNTNNYEVYSKTYSIPTYTAKIMNGNTAMASLEKEVLRDYIKNKNDKIARLRIVPEDIIQSSIGSYKNRITNIDTLFGQILSTEILDNRIVERKVIKDKVLEASRDNSEPVTVQSNNYYALIGNDRFITWADGNRVRKVLLQGMLDGNQSATDSLINLWNDHITQD